MPPSNHVIPTNRRNGREPVGSRMVAHVARLVRSGSCLRKQLGDRVGSQSLESTIEFEELYTVGKCCFWRPKW